MNMLAQQPVSGNNDQSNDYAVSYRLCASLVAETRHELALFVARVPEFQAEIDAVPFDPADPHGRRIVTDLPDVKEDFAGLADLLTLIETQPIMSGQTRVYHTLAVPLKYDDALTLIVARVTALANRLENHLEDVQEAEYNLTGTMRCIRSENGVTIDPLAPLFRAAAWGARNTGSSNGGVLDSKLKTVKMVLAAVRTDEATAWDEASSVRTAMLAGAMNPEANAARAAA